MKQGTSFGVPSVKLITDVYSEKYYCEDCTLTYGWLFKIKFMERLENWLTGNLKTVLGYLLATIF